MLPWRPAIGLMSRLVGHAAPEPESVAHEWWEIAPAERRRVAPAIALPGQIERVTRTEFGTKPEVIRHLLGGFETDEGPTRAFALRDAVLLDGVLYAGRARRHLRPDARLRALPKDPEPMGSGVLYESWVGNRWFGNWLTDDCVAYALAERFGVPVATLPAPKGHARDYEQLLGQRPRRLASGHFDELILLDDHGNTADRAARAARLTARLRIGLDTQPHPGVFLVRGVTGARRLLVNESAIADRLRDRLGFRVLDPEACDLATILGACAGARVVVGVEGSQLAHGLMVMGEQGTVLTLQPPDRVTSALKIFTDRQGQGFGLVVGRGTCDGFEVDGGEVLATLALISERRGV